MRGGRKKANKFKSELKEKVKYDKAFDSTHRQLESVFKFISGHNLKVFRNNYQLVKDRGFSKAYSEDMIKDHLIVLECMNQLIKVGDVVRAKRK